MMVVERLTAAEIQLKVKRLVDRAESERADRLKITDERLLEEAAKVALSNMQDFTQVNEEGQLDTDMTGVTRDQMASVTEFTVDTSAGDGDGMRRRVLRTRVKLGNKLQAIELCMKVKGMLREKLEITNKFEGMTDEEIIKQISCIHTRCGTVSPHISSKLARIYELSRSC